MLLIQTAAACAQTTPAEIDTLAIRETGQGQVDFSSKAINELSGITYYGTDLFALVSDKGGKLGFATIEIDRETGKITRATLEDTQPLKGGRDLEDIALDWTGCVLFAVDEADQSLTEFQSFSGERHASAPMPGVFKKARANLGLEALTVSREHFTVWVANEEPLTVDGPRATSEAGGLIRLQSFGVTMEPANQFAYRVDPHRGSDNLLERAQSGIVGLVALPNGGLIVMERELGGAVIPSFRIRLYLIDTEDATDTSAIEALTEDNTTPVRKQLLFESNTGFANFEGITLGPRLNNGDYTLILVSDNGGGTINPQNLLSLRIPASLVERPPKEQALASESD
ncbi:MAG: esterase-like activity of phytase family protein [Planctomycetota bacterium]